MASASCARGYLPVGPELPDRPAAVHHRLILITCPAEPGVVACSAGIFYPGASALRLSSRRLFTREAVTAVINNAAMTLSEMRDGIL